MVYFHCNLSDFEVCSSHNKRRDHKSDFEVSEEEKKTRMGSLKKKAIDASTKIRMAQSLSDWMKLKACCTEPYTDIVVAGFLSISSC
jgi:hypothetical protein